MISIFVYKFPDKGIAFIDRIENNYIDIPLMCFVYINQICMLYSRTKCTVAITEVMKLKAYAKLGPEFPQHLEK